MTAQSGLRLSGRGRLKPFSPLTRRRRIVPVLQSVSEPAPPTDTPDLKLHPSRPGAPIDCTVCLRVARNEPSERAARVALARMLRNYFAIKVEEHKGRARPHALQRKNLLANLHR